MALGLGLVAMELDQLEQVLAQEVLDQVALDQVDMGPAMSGQDKLVSEPGQVVLDKVVVAQDQAAMEQLAQGLVVMVLEVKDWGQESPLNQV